MKLDSMNFLMDPSNCKQYITCHLNSTILKCLILALMFLVLSIIILSSSYDVHSFQQKVPFMVPTMTSPSLQPSIRKDKFLEVPQIAWGLNNQKIAFARAALTARLLNRTLLIPSLSASLFYKEVDLLEPISFDKIFKFEKFNSMCKGFVQLGLYSDLLNQSKPFELQKGSGRRWTKERDFNQLKQCMDSSADKFEIIRILGKNPFLWHDHWPVKDYAKVFECLVLVDEIENEAEKVIMKIREVGFASRRKSGLVEEGLSHVAYVAVHMRIEKDWMIHCKKVEQRLNITQICSSKGEIIDRVGRITGLERPTIIYVAVADSLLEDGSIVSGWGEGLIPLEKKKLGVWNIYKRYPYLIQSAIDYEVCLRSDVFVGNSFSTFSNLLVLDRTQKSIKVGAGRSCGMDVGLVSYAYNIEGESGGPQRWMTDMSASSLVSISYGTTKVSCNLKNS